MKKVSFSCPKFTVMLILNGNVIVEAASIVKTFEGQTIDALTRWTENKFGGPIFINDLTELQTKLEALPVAKAGKIRPFFSELLGNQESKPKDSPRIQSETDPQ